MVIIRQLDFASGKQHHRIAEINRHNLHDLTAAEALQQVIVPSVLAVTAFVFLCNIVSFFNCSDFERPS